MTSSGDFCGALPTTFKVIGRFAPSPTGPLHLGSLTTAVASFCHAKTRGGRWFVRLEDTDFERCKPAYSEQIIMDLQRLGLCWDGLIYQSARLGLYDEALHALVSATYACDCSRKALALVGSNIYPRLCLDKNKPKKNNKIRLIVPDCHIAYHDNLQGTVWQNPARDLGDSVIKRQNGIYNYLFTAAIDDGVDKISHVVRWLDLMGMTSTQVWIRQCLDLGSVSHHAHLPLIYNDQGQKLSKQNLATPIDTAQPVALLTRALNLLGQKLPDEYHQAMRQHKPMPTDRASVEQLIDHAVKHWDDTPLRQRFSLGVA